ncbi:MAG: sulfite exporter TauE/SafE family protein [Rhodobacteraceae bacterium]|nr:sulfite exporter TauE/SafE family protein [Paracoccaceae bacterium]
MMLFEPDILVVGLVAVALVGLSKGGLGGAFGLLGVPIMAVYMPPLQAAAVLLPTYLVMDAVSLWSWRGQWDKPLIQVMLPAAMLGIGVGWATVSIVPDDIVRLIVGIMAMLFVVRSVIFQYTDRIDTFSQQRPWLGHFWALISGFTSFVAHAGGPPFQIYVLPQRLDPKIYTGTSVLFFASLNAAKVVPYFALGQFDYAVLTFSIVLLPAAVTTTFLGAYIVRRMRVEVFYPFMYSMIFLVSLKLIFNGVMLGN